MAETKVDVDPDKIYVNNANVLDKARKDYKEWLDIKVFRVGLEVPVEKAIPNYSRLVLAVEKFCKEVEKSMLETLKELVSNLESLKKDEDAGSSKASAEAEKRVKEVDKSFKRMADEAGAEIRKVIQREIFKATGEKPTLRSVSQSFFRGMELQDGVFTGGESAAYVPYLKEISKTIAGMTKDILKKATEEKSQRNELAGEIGRYISLIVAARKSAKDLDLAEFYKSNYKEAKKIEDVGSKYVDHLRGLQDSLDKIDTEFKKLEKLQSSDDTLKKDRDVKKAADDFADAVSEIRAICEPRIKLANVSVKLPKNGEDEKGLSKDAAVWAGLPSVVKPAKTAEQAAKDLEGEAKEAAK